MKFLVGKKGSGSETTSVYAVMDDEAVDLTTLDPSLGTDLSGVIAKWTADPDSVRHMAASGPRIARRQVVPALPLRNPGKIICLGLNYVEHAKEGGYDVPDYPALFLRVQSSLMAAEEPMIRPSASETLDYEAELMVVIGKGGRHITEADALDHVFGYTCFNDGSVRVYQRKTHQWTAGKNFDQTGAIGPLVVTADEVPAGASGLRIQCRLNDQVMQDSNTANMIFPVAKTISIISEIMTLAPGDMIAFGTPPGVGHARTPPVWMKDGDVVEVEIERIGICRSPVVAEENLS